jgi:hypothetical protein
MPKAPGLYADTTPSRVYQPAAVRTATVYAISVAPSSVSPPSSGRPAASSRTSWKGPPDALVGPSYSPRRAGSVTHTTADASGSSARPAALRASHHASSVA